MANKILFKRKDSGVPPTLDQGEPAFSMEANKLYIGSTSSNATFTPELTATTAGTASAYTATITGFINDASISGTEIKLKFHTANAANATLSINSGTAYPIKNTKGANLAAGDIAAGAWVKLVFDGVAGSFFMLGGSAPTLTGNATAAQVMSGRTFYNTDANTKLTGTYVAPPGQGTTFSNSGSITVNVSKSQYQGILMGTVTFTGGLLVSLSYTVNLSWIYPNNGSATAVRNSATYSRSITNSGTIANVSRFNVTDSVDLSGVRSVAEWTTDYSSDGITGTISYSATVQRV